MLSYVISTTFSLQMQNELSIYKGKKYINTNIIHKYVYKNSSKNWKSYWWQTSQSSTNS